MRSALLWMVFAAAAAAAAAACGDNLGGSNPDSSTPPVDTLPDTPPAPRCAEGDGFLPALRGQPHVLAAIEEPCGDFVDGVARCVHVTFEQPIQHAQPAGPTFSQHLWLVHRGCDEPMTVADWGYSNDLFFDDELTILYRTNALWIEHRFQGESIPSSAQWDWTSLTIEHGARDMHRIIETLRHFYPGRWVSTGASKGGVTASYHRYFYPNDVDGSVPYVAPASRARIDPLYQDNMATALPAPCGPNIRAAQAAALSTRRPMMEARVAEVFGEDFKSLYLEYLSLYLDWGFWQYYGVTFCNRVPTAQTSDADFWDFYSDFSGITSPHPATDERSDGALYYEWLTEQGFALQVNAQVSPLLLEPAAKETMEDSFRAQYPDVALPAYNGAVTLATRAWVRDQAENMLLIYGQYDPWSGGAMETPVKPTSARFYVPNATHGAQLTRLAAAERTAALAHATRMYGRAPVMLAPTLEKASRAAEHRERRMAAKLLRMQAPEVKLGKARLQQLKQARAKPTTLAP